MERPVVERITGLTNAERLATQLRERILSGDLPFDGHVATERQLCDEAGVSRSTVREALRHLKAEGLITSRPGRGGGVAVARPDQTNIVRAIATFVAAQDVTDAQLNEARELVEAPMAAIAAQRRTDADLAALEQIATQMQLARDDAARLGELNVQLHRALAAASGNPLLQAFVAAVVPIIEERAVDFAQRWLVTDEIRYRLVRAVRSIVNAVAEGDAEAAARRVRRHLAAQREILQSGGPQPGSPQSDG